MSVLQVEFNRTSLFIELSSFNGTFSRFDLQVSNVSAQVPGKECAVESEKFN